MANHDTHLKREKAKVSMEKQYKEHVIRVTTETLSESQQKRITAHSRGNQFAEYWMGHGKSLLNRSTDRLVTTLPIKPRR
jgi:hypothetical protein